MKINDQSNMYEQLWMSLNSENLSIENENLSIPSTPDYLDSIAFFQEHNNLKIVFIKPSLQVLEDIDYLISLNYSPEYLLQNFTKRVGLATHDTREFQDRAITRGYVYAVCPLTGQVLQSNQSIPVSQNLVFYRFVGAKVFYLVTGNLGQGYAKDALYFPEDNLVVRIDKHRYGIYPEHVLMLKALLVSHYQKFLSYFSDREPKKIAVFIGHPNFAHHLWNELSALYRLQTKNILGKLDKVFVFRETLGPINEIFPKIALNKINYVKNYDSSSQQHRYIIDNFSPVSSEFIENLINNNYFLVHVGDNYIAHELTNSIYNLAKNKVNQDTKQIINNAKKTCYPLLWISIRNQDRTLINQEEVLVKVINLLAEKYPSIGIVFDGFTVTSDINVINSRYELSPEQLGMIDAERSLVKQIVNKLKPNISVFSTIGESIFIAILWARSVDLYVTHYGTLQHKIGWLAIKPGVVHTNTKNSCSKGAQLRCYAVREFGKEPKFFTVDEIRTVHINTSLNELRSNIDNYEIDAGVIYNKLIEIIDEVEREKSLRGRLQGSYRFIKQYIISKIIKLPYIKRYGYLFKS